jgi:hypothetical protein
MTVTAVPTGAERFIALARANALPPDGEWEPIVLGVLRAAGFEAGRVSRRPAIGHYKDQGGSSTDETYSLNRVSGITVHELDVATVWLNEVWARVRSCRDHEVGEYLDRIVAASRPLLPIVLTPYGETLREHPPSNAFGEHARDSTRLTGCVGVHDVCGGWVDLRRASASHDALLCRGCGLRVIVPRTLATYGDLRLHFAELQPK